MTITLLFHDSMTVLSSMVSIAMMAHINNTVCITIHLSYSCIGKPSAGKSSFLNASTDAKAKVGNYPFTTIDPNVGIAFAQVRS